MIIEVKNSKDLKKFLRIPHLVYKDDSNWIPPMLGLRASDFNHKKNSAVEGLKFKLFIYEENKFLKGRIAVFISDEFNQLYNGKTAFFGLLDFLDDSETIKELLQAAERFAHDEGISKLIGPIDFGPNYSMGALIEGFERPTLMTSYNKSYYGPLIESCGYVKAMDLYAYIHYRNAGIKPNILRAESLLQKRYPMVKIASFNSRVLKNEIDNLMKLNNAAFQDNWGFMPMSEREITNLVNYISKKGDPRLVYLAYDSGIPVGFLVSMPDTNNRGRIRLSLLGVVPEQRGRGIETMLTCRFVKDAFKKQYQEIEYSLILENNEPMNRFIQKRTECDVDRLYRVYQKELN